MFAKQTRRVFQPRYFKRLKINFPLFFGFLGLHFYDNGSDHWLYPFPYNPFPYNPFPFYLEAALVVLALLRGSGLLRRLAIA